MNVLRLDHMIRYISIVLLLQIQMMGEGGMGCMGIVDLFWSVVGETGN